MKGELGWDRWQKHGHTVLFPALAHLRKDHQSFQAMRLLISEDSLAS